MRRQGEGLGGESWARCGSPRSVAVANKMCSVKMLLCILLAQEAGGRRLWAAGVDPVSCESYPHPKRFPFCLT